MGIVQVSSLPDYPGTKLFSVITSREPDQRVLSKICNYKSPTSPGSTSTDFLLFDVFSLRIVVLITLVKTVENPL